MCDARRKTDSQHANTTDSLDDENLSDRCQIRSHSRTQAGTYLRDVPTWRISEICVYHKKESVLTRQRIVIAFPPERRARPKASHCGGQVKRSLHSCGVAVLYPNGEREGARRRSGRAAVRVPYSLAPRQHLTCSNTAWTASDSGTVV